MLGPSKLQRRDRRAKILGWVIILGSTVFFAVVVFLAVRGGETLAEDLCVRGQPPAEYWAVIVDGSDPFTDVQRASILAHFEALRDSVPNHARLALFAVSENIGQTIEPRFSLCNPGTGENLSILTDNPGLARRRWENDFADPMSSILDTLIANSDSPYSPIMETIQGTGISGGRYSDIPHRLYVFSDMMQHTEYFSHYARGSLSFSTYEETADAAHTHANLNGWKITIFYLRRRGATAAGIQGGKHIDFWDKYFLSGGGNVDNVVSIEG